jgi:uncharacterized protein
MIVDLRRLEENRGRESADEVVALTDAFGVDREIDCHIDLSYERSGGTYFFHGQLAGETETKCHLCLDEVTYRVKGDFDAVVRKGSDRGGGATEENGAKDIITLALNEHEVSFEQHIVENLIVNVPMQILCSEDCKGLCPQCGINRNKESCKCAATADPRWDALRKLKNE